MNHLVEFGKILPKILLSNDWCAACGGPMNGGITRKLRVVGTEIYWLSLCGPCDYGLVHLLRTGRCIDP